MGLIEGGCVFNAWRQWIWDMCLAWCSWGWFLMVEFFAGEVFSGWFWVVVWVVVQGSHSHFGVVSNTQKTSFFVLKKCFQVQKRQDIQDILPLVHGNGVFQNAFRSEESSTCSDRMKWVKNHVFASQENSCNLAYSKARLTFVVDCGRVGWIRIGAFFPSFCIVLGDVFYSTKARWLSVSGRWMWVIEEKKRRISPSVSEG